MSKGRIVTFHDAMEAAGLESPYAEWIKRWEDRGERTITTRVECAEYFPQRDQALLAHATQVDPDGTWFTVPLDMQREIWPTEDYEAALSYVPVMPDRGRPVRRARHRGGGDGARHQHLAADRLRRDGGRGMNTPSTSVSPGLGGFLAFFLLAIALWLLMRNMNKRMRRMTYLEEQEAAQRKKQAADAAAETAAGAASGRGNGQVTDGRLVDGQPVDGPTAAAPGGPSGNGAGPAGRGTPGPSRPDTPGTPHGPDGHGRPRA